MFDFNWLRKYFSRKNLPTDVFLARKLISAIDRGGIPLNPAKVNAIARDLGLEVSTRAPVEETIARIRAYLQRM
ncbi:hypothetical protein [Azonexus sp.]|uniref:hypothetical protein n=1 Tax=Azonexus sp. TaxID=1872668 RepID=UPI0027B8BBAD|nr:hypothetical protein [Azonexus sp.]